MDLSTSYIVRLSKIIILLTVAGLAGIVVFGNITDYNSNYQFVKHVMSMDTKPDYLGKAIEYRAITATWFHHVSYICIIIWETTITILALMGAYNMWKNRNTDTATFLSSKKYGITALIYLSLKNDD